MTILQKLQVRQSEIRESINTLLGNDARTDDQQGELEKLTGEGQKLEPEIRAAIIASPDPAEVLVEGDAADVELRSLIHDASPGRILAAVHSRRNTDGREAELQEHFKVAGNELPHAMLETRAQTQAPSDVATQQAEIIQPIFGQTGAAFLNIPMPTVPAGAATYPVISSRPDPETPADGATVTADIPAGSFTADLLKPQAAQAQIEFSREDAASFPSMSDALGRVIGRASTPRVEVRESYTDTTIARLLAAASGAGDGGALAAIETAARWWGFGLASATVTPSTLALTALTPSVLDTIGRALCRAGESLHVIDVRRGRVTLTPCGGWAVHGSDDPASWTYRCDLSGPDGTRTVTRPGASVLHVRYAPHPSRPWKGRSPVRLAVDTARVAGLLENATAGGTRFHTNAGTHATTRRGRLRADRHAHAGHDREDRQRSSGTRWYWGLCHTCRRGAATPRARAAG